MPSTLTMPEAELVVELADPAGDVVAWLVGVLVARRGCLFGPVEQPVVISNRVLGSAHVRSGTAVASCPWQVEHTSLAEIVLAS